jgi:HK97 family phage prohead protease
MQRYASTSTTQLTGGTLEPLGECECAGVASTAQLARDGHVLVTGGIQLANYKRNPVVLFSHDPESPVAVCTALNLQGDKLLCRIQFPEAGVSQLADQTCALVKAGVLRGLSVGFDPGDTEPLDPSRGARGGLRILTSELFEISIVSVPADTGSMITDRALSPSTAVFRSLRVVDAAACQRAFAHVEKAQSAAALSPTMQVWALQQAERAKEAAAWSVEARRAEAERLRRIGEFLGAPSTTARTQTSDGNPNHARRRSHAFNA